MQEMERAKFYHAHSRGLTRDYRFNGFRLRNGKRGDCARYVRVAYSNVSQGVLRAKRRLTVLIDIACRGRRTVSEVGARGCAVAQSVPLVA